MKIYTKTGDDGTTGLYGQVRVSKDSRRIEVIGDVDELNSLLGRAGAEISLPVLRKEITEIQSRLFELGAELADARRQNITTDDAEQLETSMDLIEAHLPPLRAFILPADVEAPVNSTSQGRFAAARNGAWSPSMRKSLEEGS